MGEDIGASMIYVPALTVILLLGHALARKGKNVTDER